MSLLHQYQRQYKLLDHLPPASVMPFLERVRAPEHACSVDLHRGRHPPTTFSLDLGLPGIKTLLDDIDSGSGATRAGAASPSLRTWNPLSSAAARSPVSKFAVSILLASEIYSPPITERT